jgi:hypothetical protein
MGYSAQKIGISIIVDNLAGSDIDSYQGNKLSPSLNVAEFKHFMAAKKYK